MFLTFYVSDASYLWKTYRGKQIFLLMKYSMFHSQKRKTDMHTRTSYVSGGSLATSVSISADRNHHCLASLLVQQKFLVEREKRKAAKPSHYTPNYKPELCRILVLKSKLIWLQVSLLRHYQRFGKNSTVMPGHCSHHWQLQGAMVIAVFQLFPLRRSDPPLHPDGHLQVPHSRSGWATIAFLGNHFYSCAIGLLTGCITSRLLHQARSVHVPQDARLGKCLPHNAAHVRLWGSKSQLLASGISHLASKIPYR